MVCKVKTPAKINLSLDIVGKREDGYHLLETVMQSIAIFDTITVSLKDMSKEKTNFAPIRITALNPTFPCDMRNTCFKAADKFLKALEAKRQTADIEISTKVAIIKAQDKFKNRQVVINIEKKIPQAAGLAGGSSDGAAVLIALNNLARKVFLNEELLEIGVKIGADVPFCLTGGTILCKGIGEILEPVSTSKSNYVVLVKPNFGVSTPWVFSKINLENLGKRPDTNKVIDSIINFSNENLFKSTANVLETVTLPEYPVLTEIKNSLILHGATGAMMSGSGPTVFGIFENKTMADRAVAFLRKDKEFNKYYIMGTHTINHGPEVSMLKT